MHSYIEWTPNFGSNSGFRGAHSALRLEAKNCISVGAKVPVDPYAVCEKRQSAKLSRLEPNTRNALCRQYRFPVPVVVTNRSAGPRANLSCLHDCETCVTRWQLCLNMFAAAQASIIGRVVGCSDGGPASARFRRRCVPRHPRTTQALARPAPD